MLVNMKRGLKKFILCLLGIDVLSSCHSGTEEPVPNLNLRNLWLLQ